MDISNTEESQQQTAADSQDTQQTEIYSPSVNFSLGSTQPVDEVESLDEVDEKL